MNGYEISPDHPNTLKKNLTLYWSGMDTEDRFLKNWSSEPTRSQLINFNYTDQTTITYKYNSHGFRDSEFDSTPSGLALGCSFTEGIGIEENQTWPKVLSKKLNFNIWNLGIGGTGADTCFRMLAYWIDKLHIKFVTMSVPPVDRVEVFFDGAPSTLTNNQQQFGILKSWFKVWASEDQNHQISRLKNILAIEQICSQRNIPLVYMNVEDWDPYDRARDLSHLGTKSNEVFANKIYKRIIERNIL